MDLKKIQMRMEDSRYKQLKVTTTDDNVPYVFISYKSDDWEIALATIVYQLQARFGLRTYFDKAFDETNALWTEEFQKALSSPKCKAIIVFLSKHYYSSYATLLELMYSQTPICMVNRIRKPVVPIIIDNDIQNNIDELMSNEEDTGLKLKGVERMLFDDTFDRIYTLASNDKYLDIDILNSYVKEMRFEKRICTQLVEVMLAYSKSNSNFFFNNDEFYAKIALTISDAVEKTKNSMQTDLSVFEDDNTLLHSESINTPTNNSPSISLLQDVSYVVPQSDLSTLSASQLYQKGRDFEFGNDCQIDNQKAFAYYIYAYQLGCKNAAFHIAYFYDVGIGVAINSQKAVSWYTKSIDECDDVLSIYNLGVSFEYGKNGVIDLEKAFEYYLRGANKNHNLSLYRAGKFYKEGIFIEKNYKIAIDYFCKAAQLGIEDVYYEVAIAYYNGEYVSQDFTKAKFLFDKLEYKNDPNVYFYLGIIYEYGQGVEIDYVKAIQYHGKSANLGNQESKKHLQELTKQGAGALKDKIEASSIYKKASEINVDDALNSAKETAKNLKSKFKKFW